MKIATSYGCRRVLAWLSLIVMVPAVYAEMAGVAPAIIPKPAKMEVLRGVFVFGPSTKIYLETDDSRARQVGQYLSSFLSTSKGWKLPVRAAVVTSQARNSIQLSLKKLDALGPEGYELIVTPSVIRISAATAGGLFYGVQTLRQLLPPEIESRAAGNESWQVPCLRIEDTPRFSWRGMMLDCSRTFLDKDYLKRHIDRMALYKLNVLHLHLTDDQGWRLEIKKYPRLTTVGARFADRFGGGGGYYSQQEMRDLIAYARERYVTIVPEIELPGHSLEVLAAYPELACDLREQRTFEVHPFWEGAHAFSPPLCAGNEKVFNMYEDILSEVIDLFPSTFIHVGGDEVPKDSWKRCPRCQARIKEENLRDVEELQSYFIRRIGTFIASKGRRMIGWDEILEGGLAPGATVMSWRGIKGGVAAVKLGHDVVMAPNTNCYFDYTYFRTPTELVYSYNPVPDEITGDLGERILGVQGQMWTHMANTNKVFDFQMYPRIVALAEVAWSPQQTRNWSDFNARLDHHLARFDLLGIKYFNNASIERKIGSWLASDLFADNPRQFEWDVTPFLTSDEFPVLVRRDPGQKPVFVRSVVLLEDGNEIGRDDYAVQVSGSSFDTKVTWLTLGKLKPGAHYTIRVVVQGSREGGEAGSVWVMEPLPARSTRRADSNPE